MRFGLFLLLLPLCVVMPRGTRASAEGYAPTGCLSVAEIELANLVNTYRQEHGLASVPFSTTLTAVAQWHVVDFRYAEDVLGRAQPDAVCNLHTWHGIPGAPYGNCCYAPDHEQAGCMWDKPSEVSDGDYTSIGFELAGVGHQDPEAVVRAWIDSPAHRDVLLNQNDWSGYVFNAMGVGVDLERSRYFLWFGTALDLGDQLLPCLPDASVVAANVIREISAFPNPFNPQVTVSFELVRGSSVSVSVHDLQGRVVREFPAEQLAAGLHHIAWDGSDNAGLPSASGTYFVRVRADGVEQSIKVAMLK